MPIIFSTLTGDNAYGPFTAGGGDLPYRKEVVVINGGANNINRKTFITPRGVATTITDAQLELCMQDPVFLQHKANGFITIDAAKDARDADQVAGDHMEGRDESAPLVDADFSATDLKPIVNGDMAKVETPAPQPPKRGSTRK